MLSRLRFWAIEKCRGAAGSGRATSVIRDRDLQGGETAVYRKQGVLAESDDACLLFFA
jgi:hypothetical protein